MTALFYISHDNLILLITVLCVILIFQSLCMFSCIFVYRSGHKILLRTLLEAAVLFWQFLLLIHSAEVLYHISEGFMVCTPLYALRYTAFSVLLLLSLAVCLSERQIYSLSTAVIASITLPWAENAAGSGFSVLILLSAAFWLIRNITQLLFYRTHLENSLSEFSVKEAIDTMDFGVLFCSADKKSEGQILLTNEKMQQLMLSLCAKVYYDGKLFYNDLLSGNVPFGKRLESLELQPVYELSDGSVWRFSLQHMSIKNKRCTMLFAADMTEQEKINTQLYRRTQELQQRNTEIKEMLSNLKSVCRAEQTIKAKAQVHAVLGQQISLLLRSVREHREPDDALLKALAGGIREDLKNNTLNPSASLKSLIRNFESLGIKVCISGELPRSQKLRKVFYDIIAEAMTNSVHHAHAEEIFISVISEDTNYLLKITDDGVSADTSVQEGGGLSGIRSKAEGFGGEFSYSLKPHFSIYVRIPKEADYD